MLVDAFGQYENEERSIMSVHSNFLYIVILLSSKCRIVEMTHAADCDEYQVLRDYVTLRGILQLEE